MATFTQSRLSAHLTSKHHGEQMNDNYKQSKPAIDVANPRLVPLPEAPQTKSPVPWLTSLHAKEGRGEFGDSSYRGNCSGLLIEDLLSYYQPRSVLDPMAGGGTCPDVCKKLGI